MKNNSWYRWFTLIEMLIVMVVIAILATITLKLDWWQINDMRAMNEREQRLSWHRKNNNLITNTNYISNTKWETVIFQYNNTWITMISSGWESQFLFKNNTFSWEQFTLTKKALSLWCESTQTTLQFIWTNRNTCFNLNTQLCSRTPCSNNN